MTKTAGFFKILSTTGNKTNIKTSPENQRVRKDYRKSEWFLLMGLMRNLCLEGAWTSGTMQSHKGIRMGHQSNGSRAKQYQT